MIKTIIVPTDGSDHANRAVAMAGEIAAKFGARVIILQALLHHTATTELKSLCAEAGVGEETLKKIENLEEAMFDAAAAAYAPVPLSIPVDVLQAIGEGIAKKASETLREKGVGQMTVQVTDGNPAENIIAAAEREKAELIVMGRRGLGDIAGLLMGSVSHKVTHLAECACLTVK